VPAAGATIKNCALQNPKDLAGLVPHNLSDCAGKNKRESSEQFFATARQGRVCLGERQAKAMAQKLRVLL